MEEEEVIGVMKRPRFAAKKICELFTPRLPAGVTVVDDWDRVHVVGEDGKRLVTITLSPRIIGDPAITVIRYVRVEGAEIQAETKYFFVPSGEALDAALEEVERQTGETISRMGILNDLLPRRLWAA